MPATDDEVMAVEDLLEDDKCEVGQVIDAEQTVECNKIEAYHLGKTQFENPQGQSAFDFSFCLACFIALKFFYNIYALC